LYMKYIFRTLRYRNFRLFFIGQGLSLIGTWMQQLAMSWLVYRLTGSPVMLGVTGFLAQMPAFFMGPFAGVISDRFPRRTIQLWTQVLAMLQAFALTVLVVTGHIAVWQIIVLSVFLGLIFSVDAPARQAFLAEIIEKKEDFGNAIALNSAMFNGARLVGPAIAGLTIAAVGEGLCFFLNGVSFLAVIIALLSMRLPAHREKHPRQHIWREFKDGLNYILNEPRIWGVLCLLGAVSLLATPYMTLAPAFARDILQGTARTLGFLMTAAGAGAMTGSLYFAGRKNTAEISRSIPLATFLLGLGIVVFALSRALWLSLPALFMSGFAMMIMMASCNTLVQTLVDDRMRGRVMSFYSMAFMGMMPFGSLIGGAVAGRIGVPATVLLSGTCCILAAVFFAGILPAYQKRHGTVRKKEQTAAVVQTEDAAGFARQFK
jgi:MFS family permease